MIQSRIYICDNSHTRRQSDNKKVSYNALMCFWKTSFVETFRLKQVLWPIGTCNKSTFIERRVLITDPINSHAKVRPLTFDQVLGRHGVGHIAKTSMICLLTSFAMDACYLLFRKYT